MTRNPLILLAALGGFVVASHAGPAPEAKVSVPQEPPPPAFDFSSARRPLTNPTLFDLPITRTQLHPIFVYHRLPSHIETILGDLPADGRVIVGALQFEYAFNEDFSLIATKDGYIDIDADQTLSDEGGWANLAAGLKWNFLRKPDWKFAAAGSLVYEAPTGSSEVLQGAGDGDLIPQISTLWMPGKWQFNDTLGLRIPIDSDAGSTFLYASAHVDYAVTENFFPTLELNWFHVLDTGDGGTRFGEQVGSLVPAAVRFEGGDFFNLGASNASAHSNFVSLGLGFRYKFTEKIDVGFAYELPLTDKEASLMEDRFTLDLVWQF